MFSDRSYRDRECLSPFFRRMSSESRFLNLYLGFVQVYSVPVTHGKLRGNHAMTWLMLGQVDCRFVLMFMRLLCHVRRIFT